VEPTSASPGGSSSRPLHGAEARSNILAEIVTIQELYRQRRDVDELWQHLLTSVLRCSGCEVGFIGELVWNDIGIPNLETRASTVPGSLPPDLGLIISEVIARSDDVMVAPEAGAGFLGMPLVVADRILGVVGLAGPTYVITNDTAEMLRPLVGVVAAIVESITNATQRDAVTERLQRNLGFLEAVVGSASYGVVVVDPEGTIELANEAAITLLGAGGGALVGDSIGVVMSPRAVDWVLSQIVSASTSDPITRRTVQMLSHSGAPFRADVTVGTFTLDEDRAAAVLTFRDIEAELLAQATALRSADLLSFTPDLVVWSDATGAIEYINAGGRALTGVTDIDGMNIEDLFPPWAAERFGRDIVPELRSNGSWIGEMALVDQGGEEIPVSMSCLFRHEGDNTYYALLARDLREHQHLELLQHAFVSTVSHELRTPLTGILGYLEMFGAGDLGDVDPEQKLALDVMSRSGDRLLALVDKLLQVASIGETAIREPEPVQIAAVLEQARSSWADQFVGTITTDTESVSCAEVSGSAVELATVFSGLFENAVKFSPNGGDIVVSAKVVDSSIMVEVSDTGIGIPPVDVDRVFDRFFRASNAREMESQGAGLGLAIARAIVRKHGGEITVTSAPEEGTLVRVILPVAQQGQTYREGGDRDGESPGGR
jgi:PAS domain S-box-containing protein